MSENEKSPKMKNSKFVSSFIKIIPRSKNNTSSHLNEKTEEPNREAETSLVASQNTVSSGAAKTDIETVENKTVVTGHEIVSDEKDPFLDEKNDEVAAENDGPSLSQKDQSVDSAITEINVEKDWPSEKTEDRQDTKEAKDTSENAPQNVPEDVFAKHLQKSDTDVEKPENEKDNQPKKKEKKKAVKADKPIPFSAFSSLNKRKKRSSSVPKYKQAEVSSEPHVVKDASHNEREPTTQEDNQKPNEDTSHVVQDDQNDQKINEDETPEDDVKIEDEINPSVKVSHISVSSIPETAKDQIVFKSLSEAEAHHKSVFKNTHKASKKDQNKDDDEEDSSETSQITLLNDENMPSDGEVYIALYRGRSLTISPSHSKTWGENHLRIEASGTTTEILNLIVQGAGPMRSLTQLIKEKDNYLKLKDTLDLKVTIPASFQGTIRIKRFGQGSTFFDTGNAKHVYINSGDGDIYISCHNDESMKLSGHFQHCSSASIYGGCGVFEGKIDAELISFVKPGWKQFSFYTVDADEEQIWEDHKKENSRNTSDPQYQRTVQFISPAPQTEDGNISYEPEFFNFVKS